MTNNSTQTRSETMENLQMTTTADKTHLFGYQRDDIIALNIRKYLEAYPHLTLADIEKPEHKKHWDI